MYKDKGNALGWLELPFQGIDPPDIFRLAGSLSAYLGNDLTLIVAPAKSSRLKMGRFISPSTAQQSARQKLIEFVQIQVLGSVV